MLKRILIIITAAFLAFSAVACSLVMNPTLKYLEAMEKMSGVETYESNTRMEINMDLSKASPDTKAKLEKYKKITLNVDEVTDNKAQKAISTLFISAGDIAVDPKIYRDGDNIYVKTSMSDKYYKIDQKEAVENAKKAEKSGAFDNEKLKTFTDEVKTIWKDAVEKEIVSKEGSSVENTPDGDIKVTNLSLAVPDDKLKGILYKLAQAASKNEYLKEQAIMGSGQYAPKEASKEEINKSINDFFTDLASNMKKLEDKYTVDNLKLTAKVDKDANIIKQALSGSITLKYEGEIKVNFNVEMTSWNINGKVKVELPQINKEDIASMDDLKNREYFDKFKEDLKIK